MTISINCLPEKPAPVLSRRFERKYYITPNEIDIACGFLRHICRKAEDYPFEKINSLYFDTVDLEQHERSGSGDYHKDKVRIRWYGEDDGTVGMRTAFIELKSRRGFAGTKQRAEVSVPAELLVLSRLTRGIVPPTMLMDVLAGFGYFPPGMLLPVIKISYWRHSFREIATGQRISLDCTIQSTVVLPGLGEGERELELPGGVIELKGDSMEIPPSLRRMALLYTDWTRFSKYSACIDAHCERQGSVGCLSPSGRLVW